MKWWKVGELLLEAEPFITNSEHKAYRGEDARGRQIWQRDRSGESLKFYDSCDTLSSAKEKMLIRFRHQIFKSEMQWANFNFKFSTSKCHLALRQSVAHISRTPPTLCRETICQKLQSSCCWQREWHQRVPWAGSQQSSQRRLSS